MTFADGTDCILNDDLQAIEHFRGAATSQGVARRVSGVSLRLLELRHRLGSPTQRGEVTLSRPVHVDALGGKTEYDISARLPRDEYRRQIVQFAETARTFYFSAGPRPVEDWEQDFHGQFWAKFSERLARARSGRGG